MPIDFSPEQWDRIKKNYELWWEGRLGRPIIPMRLSGRDPGRPESAAPLLSQQTCADFSLSPSGLIDRIDYELSKYVYLGDAFPYFNMDCFGPGITAAFCGAKLDNSSGSVWFFPEKRVPISDLHFEYDENNIWLNRIKEICRAGMERWQGQVLIGMTDLGGVLDVLATFRSTETLLTDLYDFPEEVERLVWELHGLWHRFYNEINAALQPVNPGYTDWSELYSTKPSFIAQCDFSYMISPGMFDRFVQPELAATCRRLPRTFYHLDGVGELAHLDSVLAIPDLDGVQWVPGDGRPAQRHWPEVYRKIHAAKKRMQIWDGFECLDMIYETAGLDAMIHHRTMFAPMAEKESVIRNLARYGVES